MHARLLGAVRLKSSLVQGEKPRELSGLAWDSDEGILFAVSDDGLIVHLKPIFAGDLLTDLVLIAVHPLRDENGAPLTTIGGDGEGLVGHHMSNGIPGDAYLSVSFEEQPRIDDYSLDGRFIKRHQLPTILAERENYAGDNQELEALSFHPKYGFLTAPERPLRNSGTDFFTIYSLTGESWHYPSLDKNHSALVGMETAPNGNLLVLERRFASMFQPIIFAVRELSLSEPEIHEAKLVREIIQFNSSDGWKIDNFESIAHHEGQRYFVVSDDNESLFQKTLLLYFEILEHDQSDLDGDHSVSSKRGINSTKLHGLVR